MKLTPKAGFDWSRVKWGGAEERRTQCCSYCAKPFPDEDDDGDFVPLILWKKDGSAAEFCDDCQTEWFGIWSPKGEDYE